MQQAAQGSGLREDFHALSAKPRSTRSHEAGQLAAMMRILDVSVESYFFFLAAFFVVFFAVFFAFFAFLAMLPSMNPDMA
jgi:hypothetical protein